MSAMIPGVPASDSALNIRDMQVSGERDLLAARLYSSGPASVKRDSLIVFFHGGGFVAGDKHYRRALSRWAANMGYFVVNVN